MEENRFPGDQIENKGNGRINLWKDEVTDHEKKNHIRPCYDMTKCQFRYKRGKLVASHSFSKHIREESFPGFIKIYKN